MKRTSWTLVLALGSGCVGSIDVEEAAEGPTCGTPVPASARRLTAFEYDQTIRDLLGDDSAPGERGFPPEEAAGGFDNNAAAQTVSDRLAESYLTAAEEIAERAVADLDTLLACDPGATDEDCAAVFIESFATRAYRRPPDAGELSLLRDLYDSGRGTWDHATGVRLVIQTVLQSPRFLYRVETGDAPGAEQGWTRLTPWETASRLSYFLWGSMPDEELFAAAGGGRLVTDADVADQARRMLADPRAREQVAHFHEQWLGIRDLEALDKDAEVFPMFSPELLSSMREETRAFVASVFFDGDATIRSLLTAPYTMVDPALAAYYGVDGVQGPAFQRAELPGRAAGVLTQGSLMATGALPTETSPILRGKLVQEMLLCNTLPSPPDDLEIIPPDPDPSLTTRERFEQHRADPACAGCHSLMDPIGFGFEHFDGAGRWRDTENGFAIDASGELTSSDVNGPFVGAVELGERLAGSQQVRACVAAKWFTYAYGRAPGPDDQCTMDELAARLAATDGDLRELLVALTQTDVFRFRATGGDL